MIKYVDAALEEAIKQLNPELFYPKGSLEITFKAPTKETVQLGEHKQCVDIYLYEMQDAVERRESGSVVLREIAQHTNPATGQAVHKPVARHTPPRYLKLSYMLTVWTAEPKDSHDMLGLSFAHLAKLPVLTINNYPWPDEKGNVSAQVMRAKLSIGHPPVQDRILTELWTSFANTLVPFLNVTVTVPVPTFTPDQIAHVVEKVIPPVRLAPSGMQEFTEPPEGG